MIREPLMVSDTVMVLLRQYIQVCDDEMAMYSDMLQDNDPKASPVEGRNIRAVTMIRTRLGNEILREMWHLWTYPDVKLVRHLEWHLVLNKRMMDLSEMAFLLPGEYQTTGQRRVMRQAHLDETYIRALVWAYQEGLTVRNQTKTTP